MTEIELAPQTVRELARRLAREIALESATADLREVSAAELGRIVGMTPERAVRILRAGEIPEAYLTEGGREWRVPTWAIRAWQERRAGGGQTNT